MNDNRQTYWEQLRQDYYNFIIAKDKELFEEYVFDDDEVVYERKTINTKREN